MLSIKKSLLSVLMGLFIVGFFHIQGFAKLIANTSEIGFEEPGRSGIRPYVIDAAGSLLISRSDFLLFLNKIELEEINGIDFTELQQIINNAVAHMENAKAIYTDLTQLADSTAYDQSTINNLMNFNYSSFQNNKGLNSVIFNKVGTYLNCGDIRGLYHQLLADTQSILDRLIVIKSVVDDEVIPGNSDLWQINQSYVETLLFGQYAAEIFYDLAGN